MRIGSLESPILVENTWAVCYDSGELGSAQTSISIQNLNGNVDEEYRLIIRQVSNAASATFVRIRPNNDSTATGYGYQRLTGQNVTVSAARGVIDYWNYGSYYGGANNNELVISEYIMYVKSGYVRTLIEKISGGITGTTVTDVNINGGSWNDTSSNITNLVLFTQATNGLGVGSRIILLKKVTNTTGLKTGALEVQGKVYGVWQEVYKDTLGSAQTSVTISGLDGNTDVMYKLKWRVVNVGSTTVSIRLNNDSTASIYGNQWLYGAGVDPAAARQTLNTIDLANGSGGGVYQGSLLLYAKTGFVRTIITEFMSAVSGTTVNDIDLLGYVYNETTTNLTSIVFYGQTNGLGIGTYICLEKLVLS